MFLSCGGFEAHMTPPNGCRGHGHCESVSDLVAWHTQGSRLWVSVCELMAYGHLSPPVTLMTPSSNWGMVVCPSQSVFTCLLTSAMSLPHRAGCLLPPAIFAMQHLF